MREFILNYGNIIVIALAVIDFILMLALLTTPGQNKGLALIMTLVALGLCYDAGVVAVGSILRDNPLLVTLSQVRYLLHGFMVPLMVPISLYALQPTGKGKIFTWLITLVLLAAGIAFGYFTKIEPVEIANIFRYTASAETPKWASILDRVMTIGSIIPLIFSGVIVLINQKNIALLFSGIVMVVFSALGPLTGNADLTFLIGMVGETLMLVFFLLHVRTAGNVEE